MDRRVRKTRKAIQEAFLHLAQNNELNKIKVSELAELADINRKTFYLHYKDIYEVVEKIEEEFIEKVDFLKSKITLTIFQNSNKEFIDLLFEKLSIASTQFKPIIHTNLYNQILCKSIEHLRELLIREYSEMGGKDQKIFSYAFTFLSKGIIELYIEWYSSGNLEDQELVKELITFFLDNRMNLLSDEFKYRK